MKTIKIFEKVAGSVALLALLILITTRFNPLTGAVLFFACLLLALTYLFLSPWIFAIEQRIYRPVLKTLLIGAGLALLIVAWIPGVFNWPIRLPLYESGLALFVLAVVYECMPGRKQKELVLMNTYRKSILVRSVIIIAISSFFTKAPREMVYSLLNIQNEGRIMSEVAMHMYKSDPEKALKMIRVWQNKHVLDSRFLRLYGEVLLTKGDSSQALLQFQRSYDLDSNLSAWSNILLLKNKPVFLRTAKTSFAPYLINDGLVSSTPESQGVSFPLLQRFYSHGEKIPLLAGLMVLKNNKIIAERYYHYSPWHVQWTFSTWKSMVATIAGIALDKKIIKSPDQKLSEFFPVNNYHLSATAKDITLKQLLTMRSGLNTSEDGTYWDDKDPAHEIFAQPMTDKPGMNFGYASRNMFLVKEIVEKTSSIRFPEFCKKYADSLQILKTVFSDPAGYEWDGSVLTLRDMAKFGLLFCNNGKYKNQQVISEKWMNDAMSEQVTFKKAKEGYTGYGFFFWLSHVNNHKLIAARGKGGQFIVCVPDCDLVLVSFSSEWNDRGFAEVEDLIRSMATELCK